MNQSDLEVNACSWRETQENVWVYPPKKRLAIGFGFTSDWVKKVARVFWANRVA